MSVTRYGPRNAQRTHRLAWMTCCSNGAAVQLHSILVSTLAVCHIALYARQAAFASILGRVRSVKWISDAHLLLQLYMTRFSHRVIDQRSQRGESNAGPE